MPRRDGARGLLAGRAWRATLVEAGLLLAHWGTITLRPRPSLEPSARAGAARGRPAANNPTQHSNAGGGGAFECASPFQQSAFYVQAELRGRGTAPSRTSPSKSVRAGPHREA